PALPDGASCPDAVCRAGADAARIDFDRRAGIHDAPEAHPMMWRRSIWAALILAALVAVFAAGEWAQRRAAQREEAQGRFLPLSGESVERLEIENEDGRIVLERAQEGWRMTEPVEDGADFSTVQTLLQFFNAALTTNRFEPRNLPEYGLDPPAVS